MRSFAKVQSDDRVISQLQDNAGKVIDALAAVPLNSGILLNEVVLAASDNTIYTTLPTGLIGWIITKKSANSNIYDKQSTNTNTKTLVLNSSAIVTVDIFVF